MEQFKTLESIQFYFLINYHFVVYILFLNVSTIRLFLPLLLFKGLKGLKEHIAHTVHIYYLGELNEKKSPFNLYECEKNNKINNKKTPSCFVCPN